MSVSTYDIHGLCLRLCVYDRRSPSYLCPSCFFLFSYIFFFFFFCLFFVCFFFQAEDGIRDLVRSRGLGDVYKRQRQLNIFSICILDGGEFHVR